MAKITLEATDLKTVKEAADLLGVSEITVWRYVNKGKMLSTKIAGRRLIPISEITRVLAELQLQRALAEQAVESSVDSSDNG